MQVLQIHSLKREFKLGKDESFDSYEELKTYVFENTSFDNLVDELATGLESFLSRK